MEAFFVCIIFLGVLLVLASLFFIMMDRVNGKDFFKEFDRKKEEMFSLIQDSEEMIEELNQMSDYVVSMISEKNQEFFNKFSASEKQDEAKSELEPALNISAEKNKVETIVDPNIRESNAAETKTDVSQPNEVNSIKVVNTQISNNILEKQEEATNTSRPSLILNSKRREVMKMIEQGLSNDEIAEKMKIGKGEIGLIRGLSRQ